MLELYHTLLHALLALTEQWGYFGIAFLMALESSFFPFPSEAVLPPAGYMVFLGKMNMPAVVLASVIGSIAGALVNYYLARQFGMPLLRKLIKEDKLNRANKVFNTHGAWATFFGRLVPVIRQYISFPAGLANMHLGTFIFYTTLGSVIWSLFLGYLGYFFGSQQEFITNYAHQFGIAIIAIVTLFVLYKYYKIKKKKHEGK